MHLKLEAKDCPLIELTLVLVQMRTTSCLLVTLLMPNLLSCPAETLGGGRFLLRSGFASANQDFLLYIYLSWRLIC